VNTTPHDARDLAPAHESLVEAALESFDAASRAAVWARFAAGALMGANASAPEAAAAADELLAEYDRRFP
jgi:hypothetical protein